MKKRILLVFISLAAIVSLYYFWPEEKLGDVTIDRILVLKSEREMQVFSKGKLLKTYTISLGRNPVGDKVYEGDKRTPEGLYFIDSKNPNSGWHKNLGISYPNADDRKRAAGMGKPAGGEIKIHGLQNGRGFIGKFHRWMDWTAGCIAVTDAEADELYEHTPVGTPIEIRP